MVGKYQAYPEYKDSGVEWLGKVPEDWAVKKLKYICSVQTGDKDTVMAEDNGKYPFFVRSQTVERINSFGADCEAVLTAGDGVGVGKVFHYYQGKFDYHQRVYMLSDFYLVLGRFVFYYLSNNFYKVALEGSAKSTVDSLRLPQFLNFEFSLPDIKTQKKIVKFLDHETAKIDTLIDKQQQLIQLLKEKRQAVISHAVTKGLNPNAPMRDSGVEWLGEVPEHWEIKPLKYLISDRKGAVKAGPFGSHLKNSDMEDSDVKVISQRNVISRDLSIGESMISFSKYRDLQGFTIFKNDILVTTRGTIGRTFIYDKEEIAILHPCLIRLQIKPNLVFSELVALIIQESGYAMEQILLNSNATTIEVIYSENLINTVVCLPPSLLEQQELLEFIEQQKAKFDGLIGKAQLAIDLMQERRTALISAAVTGKIDVRNWSPA